MSTTIATQQRLRTLESKIRKAAESIQKNGLEIGRDLCEIRDDELWRDEFESWNQYLKERAESLVGKSYSRAEFLMQMTEVAGRLPASQSPGTLSPKHLKEIKRLAPDVPRKTGGIEKDISKLRKSDVARVIKSATEIAGGKPPSVRDVRKAVDVDLGIDRTAKAAETKERNNAGIELADYIRQSLGRVQGITNNLAKVPGESWKLLEESEPDLAKRFAEACDELAELLRS